MECLWELDEVMLRSFWKASQASADELPFVQEDAANILFSNFMAGAEGIEVCPLEAIGEEDRAVLSSLCHHSPAVKCIVNVQATHDHD